MSKKIVVKIVLVLVAIAALVAIVLGVIFGIKIVKIYDEQKKGQELIDFLYYTNYEHAREDQIASWNYEANMSEENKAQMLNISLKYAKIKNETLDKMKELDWENFIDAHLKFVFKSNLSNRGETIYDRFEASITNVTSKMQKIYSTTKICDYNDKTKCDLNLEPEITEILENSQDPNELKHVWLEWHNKVGRKCRKLFDEYVQLRVEFENTTNYNELDSWLQMYDDDDIEQHLKDLWLDIRPLYLQFHAYVRKQLFNKYGPNLIDRTGPIPAHLLGMWAQTWSNVESYTRPYQNKPDRNITSMMIKKNYTALKIFEMADEFFQSINLTKVPQKFWENSVLTKPDDGREIVCHPSAWDFNDGEDFRIKQCTVVNAENFETAHHEMGHIQYYMQYSHQPLPYRSDPNPGFQEAIGDVIALSAMSPKHLRKIGLLEDEEDDYESEINELFKKGASKLPLIQFAYMLDVYRLAIFRGQITHENYNCHFWKLKEGIQGVEPPVKRTEEDLDAAAKFHVVEDIEYIRYFISNIVEFQFHKALCSKAGEYEEGNDKKKLSNCDIYQSAEAGNALGDMLKLGSTYSWEFALHLLTGERTINATSILEYFEPLKLWLEKENNRTGELIGWEKSKIEFCTLEQEADFLKIFEPMVISKNNTIWF